MCFKARGKLIVRKIDWSLRKKSKRGNDYGR